MALLREMIDRGMAMIPTLKMFADTVGPSPTYLEPIYEIVRRYHRLGGQLVIRNGRGLHEGLTTDDEFRRWAAPEWTAMVVSRCSPPRLRNVSVWGMKRVDRRGETGGPRFLLEGDPMEDLLAFSRVTPATIRAGRLLYLRLLAQSDRVPVPRRFLPAVRIAAGRWP